MTTEKFDDTPWTLKDYKTGYDMISTTRKDIRMGNALCDEKISQLPLKNYREFLISLSTPEFSLRPYRVYGKVKNQAEAQLVAVKDLSLQGYTICTKHAYCTLFIFNMTDTRLQKESFNQIMLERFYSKKKGKGIAIIKQLKKMSNKYGVTLTVWAESEKLKNYFENLEFTYQYKSITTGHYFLTYNFE